MNEDDVIMHIIEGYGKFEKIKKLKGIFSVLDYYFEASKWCEYCLEFMLSRDKEEIFNPKDENNFKFCLYLCTDCFNLTNLKKYTFRHIII